MRRRIGRPAALLLLAASLVAGTGAGLAGQSLSDRAPDSTGTPPGASSPSPDSLLGADDLLTVGDFELIGWPGLRVDSLASGEPQFAYACQRQSLTDAVGRIAVVSVDWLHGSEFTASQTVAEMDAPPQARQLFRRVSGWYRDCRAGDRSRPSTLVTSADTSEGAAQVWRIGSGAPADAAYGVVAVAGDRVGLVDVYGDTTPVDPDGLHDLAEQAVQRLG